MTKPNLFRITPCVSARDVDAMVRFFADVLGFKVWVHSPDFAYVQREQAAVRIYKASEGPEERCELGPRAFHMYIDVRNVDIIVAEIGFRLQAAGLGSGMGPKDQTWGQREFWVPLPEGGLIIFGQEIASGS